MSSSPLVAGEARPPDRDRRRRAARPGVAGLPAVALGVLMLVLLVACGNAAAPDGVATLVDPSASPSGSPSPSLDPEAAMEAFSDCMREHGVDVQVGSVSSEAGGDGGGGPVTVTGKGDLGPGRGVDTDALKAADAACRPLLPQGGVNGPGGEIDPEFQDQMLAFAKCMREHGVDMPDPQFGSGGNSVIIGGPVGADGSGDGPKFDPESKTFRDAQAACDDNLPGKLGNADGGSRVEVVKP